MFQKAQESQESGACLRLLNIPFHWLRPKSTIFDEREIEDPKHPVLSWDAHAHHFLGLEMHSGLGPRWGRWTLALGTNILEYSKISVIKANMILMQYFKNLHQCKKKSAMNKISNFHIKTGSAVLLGIKIRDVCVYFPDHLTNSAFKRTMMRTMAY